MKIAAIDNKYSLYKKSNINNINFCQKEIDKDKIEINASSDGKFSKKEASKNFIKGVLSPFKAIIEHPIISIGTVALTGIACSLIPVLTPVMSVGFGAMSLFQLSKGCINATKEYKKGNYDNSERAFSDIGQGIVGTLSSASSLKQGAKIAMEAKYMYLAKKPTLTNRERIFISEDVVKPGIINNLKDIGSLFFDKGELKAYFNFLLGKGKPQRKYGIGRNSFITQFKPFMIKQRAKELVSSLNPKNVKTDSYKIIDSKAYKKTLEGKSRAKLSNKDIKEEITHLYNKVCDEYGITEDLKPRLIVVSEKSNIGGSYNSQQNSVLINTRTYKKGFLDIEETIPHELRHAKTSMLAGSLSQSERETIAKEFLLGKISNGENGKVYTKWTILGAKTMPAPKMTQSMRKDFAKFADEFLYSSDSSFQRSFNTFVEQRILKKQNSGFFEPHTFQYAEEKVSPAVLKLKNIIDSDFSSQYSSIDEAMDVLLEYSVSHMDRFSRFSSPPVKNGASIPANYKTAREALINKMEAFEGNAAISTGFSRFKAPEAFAKYIFSGDEVVAEKEAAKYLVKTYTQKLQKAKSNGTLTPELEKIYNQKIERAKLIFEFRDKGAQYIKSYERSLNYPREETLEAWFKLQKEELKTLNDKISELSPPKKDRILRYTDKIATISPSTLLSNLLSTVGKKNKREE